MNYNKQRCIYCNSEDLSISDIIPFALTGAKVTKKNVCKIHNRETNEKFESKVIENWALIRNKLGLKTRDGEDIKYKANLVFNDIMVKNAKLFNKKNIYSKQIFTGENANGEKYKLGNAEKLSEISNKKVEYIDTTSNVYEEYEFNLNDLLVSEHMKRTVAKVAYEWHCSQNNILGSYKKYSKIINYILNGKSTEGESVVENVVDKNVYDIAAQKSEYGTHSLYEYIDKYGVCYVIFNFWNIVIYKVKVADGFVANIKKVNNLEVFKYALDGSKDKYPLTIRGKMNVLSKSPEETIINLKNFYIQNIKGLLSTIYLTIYWVKNNVYEFINDFVMFKENKIQVEMLLNYEEYKRVFIIYFLLLLEKQKDIYNLNKSFNENLKINLKTDEIRTFNEKDKKRALIFIMNLVEKGEFVDKIEKSIEFFNEIYMNEIKK